MPGAAKHSAMHDAAWREAVELKLKLSTLGAARATPRPAAAKAPRPDEDWLRAYH
jgi:hypothetical protein